MEKDGIRIEKARTIKSQKKPKGCFLEDPNFFKPDGDRKNQLRFNIDGNEDVEIYGNFGPGFCKCAEIIPEGGEKSSASVIITTDMSVQISLWAMTIVALAIAIAIIVLICYCCPCCCWYKKRMKKKQIVPESVKLGQPSQIVYNITNVNNVSITKNVKNVQNIQNIHNEFKVNATLPAWLLQPPKTEAQIANELAEFRKMQTMALKLIEDKNAETQQMRLEQNRLMEHLAQIENEKKVYSEKQVQAAEKQAQEAAEEAERKAKEESERKAKEEEDRKAREEMQRQLDEAKRKAEEMAVALEAERAAQKAKEEADRKARKEAEEARRQAFLKKRQKELEKDREKAHKTEEERRKKEEEDARKAKEAAAKQKAEQEEAARKAKEETDRKLAEAALNAKRAEEQAAKLVEMLAAQKAREAELKAEQQKKEEAERKAKEEADRKAREEAERMAEANRKAQEELDRKLADAKREADALAASLKKAEEEDAKLRAELKEKEEEQARKMKQEAEEARKRALLESIDEDVAKRLSSTETPDVHVELSKGRVEICKPLMFKKSDTTLEDYSRTKILSQVAKTLRTLEEVANERGLPLAHFLVEGHTNCSDPKKRKNKYHMKLSTGRAKKIVSLLVKKKKCNRNMLTPKGFGGARRIYEEDHEDPNMRDVTLNQRVEFNLCNAEELTDGVRKTAEEKTTDGSD